MNEDVAQRGAVGGEGDDAHLGAAHATWYRRRAPRTPAVARPRPAPPLALCDTEREAILATLNSPRYPDTTPYAAWARLLDEGTYLASVRTFYRMLAARGLVQERRAQLAHPAHVKPELVASALIEETCAKYDIARHTLILHSDRGSPMRAKTTAGLLVDLGVAASFSRPRVSNDNPFSESQFKTLKYRPEFPACFAGLDHARSHPRAFFTWYNDAHRHSGIGFMTPTMVHFGQAPAIDTQCRQVLRAAYAAHPERFKGRPPMPPAVPTLVGINLPPPQPQPTETRDDMTTTPALLTNFHNQVSQSH